MKTFKIEPAEKVKPFLKGLDLPKSYTSKNNRQDFLEYCLKSGNDLSIASETCKRFQDVYNTIAGARLFVALSQIKEFPEIIQPDDWGYKWIRSRYISDAILLYEASFDLLLQIPWIFFKVYEYEKKHLNISADLLEILRQCRLFKLKGKVDNDLYNLLYDFSERQNKFISDLANDIKHKRCIAFKDLELSDNFLVIANNNSFQVSHTLDEVINDLKIHNNELVQLCIKVQSYIPF